MTLRVNGDIVTFDIKHALKFPRDTTCCSFIDCVDDCVVEVNEFDTLVSKHGED